MRCDGQVIALVMAAGMSRRFGADKRRAKLTDERSLLQTTAALAQTCFSETWLVLRQDDNPGELGLADTVNVIHAPASDIGLGTSLAAAFHRLDKCRGEEDQRVAAAVMLADMPWIAPTTCRRLIDQALPERILRPRHAGHLGHPVVFGRAFWPELGRLHGDQGAREVVKRNASACEVIDVDDPGILLDVDRPADLERQAP